MEKQVNIRTLGFRAVVKVLDHSTETKTKSGIFVISTVNNPKKLYKCEIISLSDYYKKGEFPPDAPYKPNLKEGDVVYVENKYIEKLPGNVLDDSHGLINIYDAVGKEEE